MKILVQKFGGTSVSTPERRKQVVEKIIKAKKDKYEVVVVVSAMGRKGEPYATDTLLSLVKDEFIFQNTLAVDLLMSCGEIISSVIICDELNQNNLKCQPLTGGQAGIITNENYGNASVLNVDTENIMNLLRIGTIPVVTGFQGRNNLGYTTTLGRGGSDVTAALLGAALNAEDIEIYTDVDGIMTADPRIVKDATLINKIAYNEILQFADQGAKVIHPRAVEIAMNANITISIKNTMSESKGTLIGNCITERANIITGITHMQDRVQIKVSLIDNEYNSNYHILLDILAKNNISIDLINVFPHEQIFTVDARNKRYLEEIMLNLSLDYRSIDDCSKISVIGSGMNGIPGVMARILKALYDEGIEVYQTADSHMTIWCLVKSDNTQKAINALHKEFNLGF